MSPSTRPRAAQERRGTAARDRVSAGEVEQDRGTSGVIDPRCVGGAVTSVTSAS